MIDFNYNTLHAFKTSGYRFLLYYCLDHFALIVPLREEFPMEGEGYIIPIHDEQVNEMAFGVDEFSFYVLP